MPTRKEFLYFEPWEKGLFYMLIALAVGFMFWQIWKRSSLWRSGVPVTWKADWLGNLSRFALGQKKVQTSRPRSGAPMHLLIFYGFLTLFVGTSLLGVNTYSEMLSGFKFHEGGYYLAYEMVMDVMGLAFVVGVAWALGRRLLARPHAVTCTPADLWALGLLLVLGVTGFWLEAARMANSPQDFDWSAPVGRWMASWIGPVSPSVYKAVWWFHMAWVVLFFAVLPRLRIRHIVMALFSTAGSPSRAPAHLVALRMEDVEATGKIGATEPKDFSRWHLLSLDACMECGRCTEVCPAWNVGKTLNPKHIVQDLRSAMASGAPVIESLGFENLMDCTTCGACVEACPVNIRHVDLIVDARRAIVAEGQLSGSGATMLRQMAGTDSAWGQNRNDREFWMRDLGVPLCRDGAEFDVLFWVGCAGATDPGAIKTTRAVASLLKKAGVRFACLGGEESCTGDPARRMGDEFQFQEQASKLVPVFERYGVRKIVTTCPHCMNTLRHEYPDFDGRYEVVHHTQLLAELIGSRRLRAAEPEPGSVVYHDPCYLARANDESDAPRALVGDESRLDGGATPIARWIQSEPGAPLRRLAEPEHRGPKTLCCGAGGGRMFQDEPQDKRPSDRRAKELLGTGAGTVAVGCPFCRIMLDAGIKAQTDAEIRLIDLAELLQEANA